MAITLEPNRLYNTNTLHLWWDGNDDLIEQKNFYYNWDLTNDPVTDLVIEDITLRTIQLIKVD